MAQEVVLLSKEEYENLLKGQCKDINKEEYEYLKACEFSLDSFMNTERLCPICKKAILIHGYICHCCGYDSSDKV